MDASIHRFGTQGLKATSLRQIAADVGVTFATVHHYFGTKEQLYHRCVEAGFEDLAGLQSALLEEAASHRGQPDALIREVAIRAFRYALGRRVTSRFLLRARLFEPAAPNRERMVQSQHTYLDVASNALGAALGRDPIDLRVPLQGLMYVLTRMAVASDEERALIAGGADDLDERLAAYVGDLAVATLSKGRGA